MQGPDTYICMDAVENGRAARPMLSLHPYTCIMYVRACMMYVYLYLHLNDQ